MVLDTNSDTRDIKCKNDTNSNCKSCNPPYIPFSKIKYELLKEIKEFLIINIKDVQKVNFRIDEKSEIGGEMFGDYVFETIYYKYIPLSYDDIISWTKEEPILIYSFIPQSCCENEEITVLTLLKRNIQNYLKRYVMNSLNRVIEDVKVEVGG